VFSLVVASILVYDTSDIAMARISSALALVALLPFLANARTIKFGSKVRLLWASSLIPARANADDTHSAWAYTAPRTTR
jgi:hypothetical protein